MAASNLVGDVPSGHHVARYCHPQRGVVRDPVTKEPVGLWPEAFRLRNNRKRPETYLSLNHFEHFAGSLADQYDAIAAVMLSKLTLPPRPVIARLSASAIVACGVDRAKDLRLRKRGSKKDPSYVHLEGMPLDNSDAILLADLARKTCIEIVTVP